MCKHPASDFEKVVKKTEVKEMAANKYAGTQTEKNLQEAFTGESQARNKYTYFASVAKKEGYEQMSALFLKTPSPVAAARPVRPIRWPPQQEVVLR